MQRLITISFALIVFISLIFTNALAQQSSANGNTKSGNEDIASSGVQLYLYGATLEAASASPNSPQESNITKNQNIIEIVRQR